jgi:hypothetical protein
VAQSLSVQQVGVEAATEQRFTTLLPSTNQSHLRPSAVRQSSSLQHDPAHAYRLVQKFESHWFEPEQ